jgi:fatty-acyl-CoA synthase
MVSQLNEPTLDRLLDQATTQFSSKEALIYNDVTVTYHNLRLSVDNLAKGLLKLGIKKGDKVCIWMTDNLYWIYSYLAIAKVGAVSIPINARYRTRDVEYILKHGDSSILIISDMAYEVQDYVKMVYEVCPGIAAQSGPEISVDNYPNLKNVVVVGPREHPGTVRIDQVMQVGRQEISDDELKQRQTEITPEDMAVIQYTSGTTSFPKGCLITHEILVRNALACALRLEIEETRDIFLDVMPPFHVLGICFGLIPSIAYGCCRIGVENFNPLEALKWIDKKKCTVHSGMGMMLKAELDHPDFKNYDLGSLRTGIFAGPSSIFQQLRELLPNWKLLNIYGLSEVGGNLATTRRNDPIHIAQYTQGTPHEGLEVKIVDLETNKTRTDAIAGEICVRGWSIMKGYYKDPEATAEVIDKDGWLHTGDKGRIDDDNQLCFEGRIRDTIKVGGENVSSAELEDFLLQHPKAKYIQIVGIKDPKYDEVTAAFIELKEGARCAENEIIEFCKGKIASFKIPKFVRFVTAWPMSATKIQKFKLKEELEKELGILKVS